MGAAKLQMTSAAVLGILVAISAAPTSRAAPARAREH